MSLGAASQRDQRERAPKDVAGGVSNHVRGISNGSKEGGVDDPIECKLRRAHHW